MTSSLSHRARVAVLLAAFAGLVFDGIELGLMPVASLSVSRSLLGAEYNDTLAGDWFARFTASLMLVYALGGKTTLLAWCRDRENNWRTELEQGTGIPVSTAG